MPVRLHWTVLLGALFFSGFRLAPGAWLGFVTVILIHELGHAMVVRITRKEALGIDIHGFGGECHWTGNATPIQRSAIAWGGIWAQLALFAVAMPLSIVVGGALGNFGGDLFRALTFTNLLLAFVNLLPIGALDGREAWKLPLLLVDKWQKMRKARAKVASRAAAANEPPRYTAKPASSSAQREAPRPAASATAPRASTGAPNDLARLFSQIAADAKDARAPKRR